MAKKRALDINVQSATASFLSKIKVGPEFICTSCHRMMYKQNVVPYNRTKYTKTGVKVLESVFSAEFEYICSDGKKWVCRTCGGALIRGNIPLQAKANGFN